MKNKPVQHIKNYLPLNVLDSFGEMLRNQSVHVNIDNSNAYRILSVGSAKPYLQNIAIDVLIFAQSLTLN